MSKFIYIQDFQIIGRNSVHYIGNYFEDCLLMWDEILKIAKENKAEAILDGGDLLDAPEPSYRILDEMADKFKGCSIKYAKIKGQTGKISELATIRHSLTDGNQ